jgi:uncharacterized protein (DUF58 family)
VELLRCSRSLVLLAAVLGLYAFFFDEPSAAVAGAGIAVFLIARAAFFLSAMQSAAGSLSVERKLSHRFIRQGSALTVTTSVRLLLPKTFSLTVSDRIPAGLSAGGHPHAPADDGSCTFSYSLTPLTIGEHSFMGVTLSFSDLFFSGSLAVAGVTAPTFTVLPSADYALKGADTYGESEGPALTPVMSQSVRSFREYVPGDDIRSIDWKLSARHDSLWVREYMGRSEDASLVIIDLPDAGAPFHPEAFARLKNAAAGSVAARFSSQRPVSILLISGPNLVSFLPRESDPLRLMAMMDRLTPATRLHHLSRYYSTASLRKRYHDLDDTPFSATLAGVTGPFLSRRPPTAFESGLARIFHGLRAGSAHLFTLAAQDRSHLRLIAERGAMGSMSVHLHVPRECDGPLLRRCGFSSVEVI